MCTRKADCHVLMWSSVNVAASRVCPGCASAGMALELGKVGLIQLTIELLREKKSGKHGEILQLLLFFLCRMCIIGTYRGIPVSV